MKTCLVIGGAGFIGRHVTRLLCESGRDVTVIGRRAKADRDLHPACRYLCGDYGNRAVLRGILKAGCEVIDLAYSTVPKTSFEDPVFDLMSNLPASVGLFQEALIAGVGRVLIVSSGGTVYGPTDQLPIREDHPTQPVSPYGITKLAIDRYAMMFHRNAGLPVMVIRPANAYAEDQRAGTGQGFIATAVAATLSGREVEIYGIEGTIRDYIHVSDVAAGIVAALDHGDEGEIYNLGTGVGTSNVGIVKILEKLAREQGIHLLSKTLPSRGFDVEANVLDSTKLSAKSGWVPSVLLENGLKRVWGAAISRRPKTWAH
ncbi:MAG: NAD-dependent epimerase/dehydratase family protein [Verrucomicrobiota bacterium]